MKKLILTAALYFSVVGYTQSNNQIAVMALPESAQGFLVLNNNLSTPVDHWKVEYMHENVDSLNNVTYTVFDRITMYSKNYTKVLKDYYTIDDVFINVKGYDASNTEIITEGPLPISDVGPFFDLVNSWTCNGTFYNYTLQQRTDPQSGASRLSLSSYGVQGYSRYQYVGNSTAADALRTYHHVSSSYNWSSAGPLLQINALAGEYFTASGTPLPAGQVYGVEKSMGPWHLGEYTIPTEFYVSSSWDNASLGYMIDFYNNNGGGTYLISEGKPLLECATEIVGSAEWAESAEYDCIEETGFQLGVDGDVNDLIDIIDACMDLPSGGLGVFEHVEFSIYDWGETGGGNTGPIVTRPFGTLVDANGEIIRNSFTLNPSLYKIVFHTDDNQYIEVYQELEETLVNNLTMSNFLTATVFPVPIVNENFEINLNATVNMNFRYKVTNLSGDVFYDEVFELRQGHNRNHVIAPNEGQSFPEGILINTFEFSDGSTMSFQTIKN